MTVAATTTQADDGMIFEEEAGGMVWIFFAVITVICIAIFCAVMPATNTDRIVAALLSGVFGLLSGIVAVYAFKSRGDSKRFYADRVDLLTNNQVTGTLAYDAVEYVAYGFRGDNDQFLSFSGAGSKPLISLRMLGDGKNAKPTELNNEKLIWLRDQLQDIVAARMIQQAGTPEGAAWFGNLRLRRDGLLAGDSVIPWASVYIGANESTGRVVVQSGSQVLGTTSMIENNVVAGLIAARMWMPEGQA